MSSSSSHPILALEPVPVPVSSHVTTTTIGSAQSSSVIRPKQSKILNMKNLRRWSQKHKRKDLTLRKKTDEAGVKRDVIRNGLVAIVKILNEEMEKTKTEGESCGISKVIKRLARLEKAQKEIQAYAKKEINRGEIIKKELKDIRIGLLEFRKNTLEEVNEIASDSIRESFGRHDSRLGLNWDYLEATHERPDQTNDPQNYIHFHTPSSQSQSQPPLPPPKTPGSKRSETQQKKSQRVINREETERKKMGILHAYGGTTEENKIVEPKILVTTMFHVYQHDGHTNTHSLYESNGRK